MLLLDHSRSAGVAMGSIGQPSGGSRHTGWTTDKALMEKLRDAGATVLTGYGADSSNQGMPSGSHSKSADTPMGWEISFAQGAEVVRLEADAA